MIAEQAVHQHGVARLRAVALELLRLGAELLHWRHVAHHEHAKGFLAGLADVGDGVLADPGAFQQLGLGFVTSVDPTQGQQGVILGSFLTMLGIIIGVAAVGGTFTQEVLEEMARIKANA